MDPTFRNLSRICKLFCLEQVHQKTFVGRHFFRIGTSGLAPPPSTKRLMWTRQELHNLYETGHAHQPKESNEPRLPDNIMSLYNHILRSNLDLPFVTTILWLWCSNRILRHEEEQSVLPVEVQRNPLTYLEKTEVNVVILSPPNYFHGYGPGSWDKSQYRTGSNSIPVYMCGVCCRQVILGVLWFSLVSTILPMLNTHSLI